MKTKKVLLFFMVLALFCGCGNGKSGEKEIEFDRSSYERADFQAISIQEGIEAFALNGDGMIFCSGADAKLYVYAKDGGGKEEIPSSSFYGNICVDGKNVYAYDYDQSAIVQLTDNGEVSSESVRVVQNSISLHTIRNMVATNGKIYVLAIPFTADNTETLFMFGAQEFEDYGEQVYCIDAQSGEHSILDLEHITAEYRSEDGRLFFYGWQEDKYYLYEYDTEKEKVSQKLNFADMGNLLNIVVEGGYLFGISSSDGLISIDLTTGEKLTWASGVYAMFGNDLQFYQGNLFVRNMAESQKILQVLAVDKEGKIAETVRDSNVVVADGTDGDGHNTGETGHDGQEVSGNDTAPQPTKRPKRNETIGVSAGGNLQFNPDRIRYFSGMKTKVIQQSLDQDAVIAELMAGNPDVDIYLLPHGWALTQRLKELGIYVPLNGSETISGYMGKCFGYIQDAATNENGDIWMIPIYESCQMTWYIPENIQKFDITPEDLTSLDSYIAVLERLHDKMGEYHYYNNADIFWLECDSRYEVNYNNYETGEVRFDTELYRGLADFFWSGWERYGSAYANHPLFFMALQQTRDSVTTLGETPDFDRDSVIFKTISISEHLISTAKVGSNKFRKLLEGWRVLPFPNLQSDSEQAVIKMMYAMVNPYSRQQEAAIEYLEVMLENQADVVEWPAFFREDMAYYEQYYDVSVPAFQDLYGIFRNADVYYGHSWDTSTDYIVEYQQGLISLDEAIERRQRHAVMGLEE